MSWSAYRIIFRLRGPLHIGKARTGNVRYTRAYVTGRAFWGALTERVTRDAAARTGQPAVNTGAYASQSETICKRLAYTYFYLARRVEDKDKKTVRYNVVWPWDEDETAPYLSSYVSTALAGMQGSALKGSLHEMQMIAPQRTDNGETTYLVGYVFEHKADDPSLAYAPLDWQGALNRLQFGADKGYGWGWVERVGEPQPVTGNALFDGAVTFDGTGDRPRLTVSQGKPILAHAAPKGATMGGEVEPVVGREWNTNNYRFAGQFVHYLDTCYAPGSVVSAETHFKVCEYGLWAAG